MSVNTETARAYNNAMQMINEQEKAGKLTKNAAEIMRNDVRSRASGASNESDQRYMTEQESYEFIHGVFGKKSDRPYISQTEEAAKAKKFRDDQKKRRQLDEEAAKVAVKDLLADKDTRTDEEKESAKRIHEAFHGKN